MTKIVYSLRAFASSNFLISLRKPKIYSSYHATVVKSKEAIPPEEFYNENLEREKELLDVANSVINSEGVRGMYSLKKVFNFLLKWHLMIAFNRVTPVGKISILIIYSLTRKNLMNQIPQY
jgi:hypothetical protein